MTALLPTVSGTVSSYSVSPALPAGLSLNTTTGVISGIPTATAAKATYLITASNAGGDTTFSLSLTVVWAGSLNVAISGLPNGTNAQVTVNGPGGYEQTLTQTTTLTGLIAGTYTTVATVVPSTAANTVFIPSVSGTPTAVSQSGKGASATVAYSKLVETWQAVGPSAIGGNAYPGAGKLHAFAVSNANPLLMYAGGGLGPGNSGPYTEAGIYKTTNGGTAWTQQNNGLTDPTVNALWMDQSNTNIVVAGTNFTGIFLTSNGGGSWTLCATCSLGSTSAFLQVGSTLYAGTGQGIAASTDTGKSWQIVESTTVPVRALASQGSATYAGLDDGQVLIQSNPGGSWASSTPASDTIWSIAINPSNAENAFAVEWMGYLGPDMYETQNGGAAATWTQLGLLSTCPQGSGAGLSAQAVAFESSSATLYAGCDGFSSGGSPLWQSSDEGGTWSNISSAGEWDVRMIQPDAEGVDGNIVVGSDQGIYLSTNAGTSWQSLNTNITSSILYSVGVEGGTILTTAQDYSLISSFNSGSTWTSWAVGGEGGMVIFNPANPGYAYIFTTAGFEYSEDGGQTFNPVQELGGLGSEFVNGLDTIALDPNNASTLYVAALSGIYESTDWGVSWTLQSSWPFGSSAPMANTPQMVAVSPANSQTLFVGANNPIQCRGGNSLLCYTTNGGSTWRASNLPSNCGWPVAIAINPANPQMILVAMQNGSILSCGILRSTDGGGSFSASTGVTQSLSPRQQGCNTNPVPSLQVDPGASGAVAAATPAGVYISTDFGLNWTSIRGNTVPLSVTGAIWSGGYLYESTCGEGVLRLSFPF